MTEFIKYNGKCEYCVKNLYPNNIQRIGKPIIHEIGPTGKKTTSQYTYYQCQDCGSIWEKLIDTGFGGYDSCEKLIK